MARVKGSIWPSAYAKRMGRGSAAMVCRVCGKAYGPKDRYCDPHDLLLAARDYMERVVELYGESPNLDRQRDALKSAIAKVEGE